MTFFPPTAQLSTLPQVDPLSQYCVSSCHAGGHGGVREAPPLMRLQWEAMWRPGSLLTMVTL